MILCLVNDEISIKMSELIYTNSDDHFYGYTIWPQNNKNEQMK